MRGLYLISLTILIIFSACKKKDQDDDHNNNNPTACNDTVTPVVFLHGTLASGDTYANMVMLFTSNNYCSNRLFVFDYNGINFGGSLDTAGLDDFIDEVLQKTNATQVNLAGHSLGAVLAINT
jgi:triacylglycerol esterase/lipase EstA (alpha/beta hydrolase family)